MKILILTQNENLYLPNPFATVCRVLSSEMCCIVSSPAMSTHGGPVKGFIKHLRLFGFKGTWIMGWRVIFAKLKAKLVNPKIDGHFYSIKQVSEAFNIPYHEIPKVKDQEFQNLLDKYQPELLISISCPQIIGKKIRDRMPLGCINVHGAPLPKYRGLMPAFWVLRNGEAKTATTVHDLGAKLDDGDIILQREVEILPDDTWESLVCKNKAAGAQALIDAVRHIKDGSVKRKSNLEEEATYFSFPTAKDRKAFIQAGRCFF
jgi:methionyl-tRNA formyltransferase